MEATKDYAFVPGGIIWKMIERTGFEEKNIRYKILIVVLLILLCWLPLVLLSFYQLGWHQFFLLFVRDVSTQVRFLLVFPLLLISRQIINKSIAETIKIFYNSRIVNADNREDFEKNIDRLIKWRNSI